MQNADKMVSLADRTEEERRQIGRAGGLKSGEKRRERKKLREDLAALLSTGDTQERVCLALIRSAMNGSTKAFLAIRDSLGEKPPEEVSLSTFRQDLTEEQKEILQAGYLQSLTSSEPYALGGLLGEEDKRRALFNAALDDSVPEEIRSAAEAEISFYSTDD